MSCSGAGDFHELRRQVGQAHGEIIYKAFDLLWLDGKEMRPLAWSERKDRLQHLIDKLPAAAASVINYVEPLHQEGATVYASVCRLGLEGIVSKRIDAPYGAGRSDARRKTRCARSETFAVVGFSQSSRGRLDGLYLARAALRVAWSLPAQSRKVSAPAGFASWRRGYGR